MIKGITEKTEKATKETVDNFGTKVDEKEMKSSDPPGFKTLNAVSKEVNKNKPKVKANLETLSNKEEVKPEPDKKKKEESSCPYKNNKIINPNKKFEAPMCNCGKGHSLVNTKKWHYRFIKTEDVNRLAIKGYRVWANPDTHAAYTYGNQVLVVIEKGRYDRVRNESIAKQSGQLKREKERCSEEMAKHGGKAYGPGWQPDKFK